MSQQQQMEQMMQMQQQMQMMQQMMAQGGMPMMGQQQQQMFMQQPNNCMPQGSISPTHSMQQQPGYGAPQQGQMSGRIGAKPAPAPVQEAPQSELKKSFGNLLNDFSAMKA